MTRKSISSQQFVLFILHMNRHFCSRQIQERLHAEYMSSQRSIFSSFNQFGNTQLYYEIITTFSTLNHSLYKPATDASNSEAIYDIHPNLRTYQFWTILSQSIQI